MSSADVQRLYEAFVAEDRGAEPADPAAYITQLEGADRDELLALIDAYLAHAPRRRVPVELLRGEQPAQHAAQVLADHVQRSLLGASGEWPVLLPRLRNRTRIARAALVAQLTERLGLGSEQNARVAAYYHEMERGLLPADGVSDRVLGALGELLGETAERLRAAGRAIAPMDGPASAPAYARAVVPPEDLAGELPAMADEAQTTAEEDLVDELFTGGPSAGVQP